jgi:tRNA-dihydrouridine synthase C
VHARTKADGYRPPAYWERIPAIRAAVSIPVIANGEIWNVDDALRCRELSGCDALMLGRGIVADPGLGLSIRRVDAGAAGDPAQRGASWAAMRPLLAEFWRLVALKVEPRHRSGRLKQWLNLLRRCYPEAEALYTALRPVNDPLLVGERLRAECGDAPLQDNRRAA